MSAYEEMESLLSGSDDYTLDSKYEIENVLLMIQQTEDKVKFFKELKQYRAKKLDEEIKSLEDRSERLRRVVLNTMVSTDPDKKTMHFPGIGKVTRRTGKTSWKIKDENELLAFLEDQGVKNQVVETKEVISKKDANKVFECFHDQDITVPGVDRKEAAESISIAYEDADAELAPKAKKAAKAPSATDTLDSIDELEV